MIAAAPPPPKSTWAYSPKQQFEIAAKALHTAIVEYDDPVAALFYFRRMHEALIEMRRAANPDATHKPKLSEPFPGQPSGIFHEGAA